MYPCFLVAFKRSMPAEQALPMIVTTVAVSLAKVAVLAGIVFLVKWIFGKFDRKN